jgi:hypothetical protein
VFVASVRNGNDVTVKMFCLSNVTNETLPDEVTMSTYDQIIHRPFLKVSFFQVEQGKDKYYFISFRVYKTKPVLSEVTMVTFFLIFHGLVTANRNRIKLKQLFFCENIEHLLFFRKLFALVKAKVLLHTHFLRQEIYFSKGPCHQIKVKFVDKNE